MIRPRAVLFGLGGTLVEPPADPGAALAEALGLGAEQGRSITSLVQRTTFASPAALSGRLRSELGLASDPSATVTAVWEAQRAEPAVLAGAAACLGAIHATGAKVAVVANAWTPLADGARAACVPFAPAIDRWILSCEAGAAKPGAGLLTEALAALDVAPAQALVVGDSLELDVAPALALGTSVVWLRRDAGPAGVVTVDPHAAPAPIAAAVVPEGAVVVKSLADARRVALTWLWASRGRGPSLTAPLAV